MWLFPALAAPLVMYAALMVQRRGGAQAAGLVGALPLTMPVAVLAVALALGDRAASTFALAAASRVPAQVVFGIVFATAMRRHGPAAAVIAGVASFAAASWLLAFVSPHAAVAIAVPALLAGPRILGSRGGPDAGDPGQAKPGVVVTCAAGTAAVALVLTVVRLAGPIGGGLFAALPSVSATLAVAIALSAGREAGSSAITGMLRALPAYLAFVAAVALLAGTLGAPAAVAAALALSAVVAGLAWIGGIWRARRATVIGPTLVLAVAREETPQR
jgi:uncharacterized membrane protein (GlpM family)